MNTDLLDTFACIALGGFLANGQDHYDGQGDEQRYAKLAYKYAKAMLEERKNYTTKQP